MIAYISQMIRRHRTTPRASLLNLLGLGFALTVLLVLIGEIRFQTSFDQWIPDSERILKLETTYTGPSGEQTELSLTPSIAAIMALPDAFPELEAVTAMWPQKLQFIINDEPVEKMATITHRNIFSVFDLPFLHGSPDIAFSNPESIVISAKEAIQLFGETSVLGKELTQIGPSGARKHLIISGVLAPLPPNTHFEINFLRPLADDLLTRRPELLTAWGNLFGYVYAKLGKGHSMATVNSAMPRFQKDHVHNPAMGENMPLDFQFVALGDVHLHHTHQGSWMPGGDYRLMQVLAGVAFAIFLIAGINYSILVAAHATKRGRDIAIRRVHGASPFKIATLQILENCLFLAAAGVLALVLVPFIQKNAVQIGFASPPSTQHTLIPILLILIFVIGSLAALLPTSLLLKFRPATILGSRKLPDIPKGRILRTALVALQFSIATGLLLCTVIMILQIRHAQTLDPGYTPTGLLVLEGIRTDSVKQSLPTLQALIEDTPRVIGVTATSLLPASQNESNLPVRKPGEEQTQIGWAAIDPAYFDIMQIPIVAGRALSRDHALDDTTIGGSKGVTNEAALAMRGSNIIANTSALARLGFSDPSTAIGQRLDVGLIDLSYGLAPTTIVGIVGDVRYRSLRDPIRPMIYIQSRDDIRYLLVRALPGEEVAVLGKIRDIWTRLFPDQPFSGRLLGQEIAALHAEDTSKTKTLAFFTTLAIMLLVLGSTAL